MPEKKKGMLSPYRALDLLNYAIFALLEIVSLTL